MSSLHIGESVPLPSVERGHTLYTENRVSSIHRGESVPPPSLYRRERVSSLNRGESATLLTGKASVSFFYKGRRETPSRCRGECASLPDRHDDILLLSA